MGLGHFSFFLTQTENKGVGSEAERPSEVNAPEPVQLTLAAHGNVLKYAANTNSA